MTLVKFEPFRELETITRRMGDIFKSFDGGISIERGTFSPKVDISEDENNVFIHAELPGMSKEDVQVTVNSDGILTLKGEKKNESKTEDKEKNFVRIERSYGSFMRSFALPENVNAEAISGKFDNGVLNLSLPKVAPAKPKEVPVEIQ